MPFRNFPATLAGLTLLVLLTFMGLQFLHISTGTLIDWVIGIAIFWWLAAVTVLPWNTHFTAKDFLEEARISREEGITVQEEAVAFARRLARRFLLLAVGLHLFSAAVLFALAYYGVIAVGYPAAVAALALTLARPAQRGYEHLSRRLQSLTRQIHYPREDVVELRARIADLEYKLQEVQTTIDVEHADSWAYTQAQTIASLQRHLDRLDASLKEATRQNNHDHENLARQSASAIARLSEDAQFLNQVRELIRFVKSA